MVREAASIAPGAADGYPRAESRETHGGGLVESAFL